MYTRNYISENAAISVPKNYDGNAFFESEERPSAPIEVGRSSSSEVKISPPLDIPTFINADDEKIEEQTEEVIRKVENEPPRASLFSFLPIKGLFNGGLGEIFRPGAFKMGSEELLIIAIAAFLFFTKGADKDCAIILLLLLLIN